MDKHDLEATMDKDDLKAANAFFRKAYNINWDAGAEPENEMLQATLASLSSYDQSRLKPLFTALLKNDDATIEKALFYDLGCQIKPFVTYGKQYRYKDARDFINHLVSYLNSDTLPKPEPLTCDGMILREADGSTVATLNQDIGKKSVVYGRLFSVASEMADFIEDRLKSAIDQYEDAFMEAEKFNTDVSRAGRGNIYGWKDRKYPDMPEWIETGLNLLARLNDDQNKDNPQ